MNSLSSTFDFFQDKNETPKINNTKDEPLSELLAIFKKEIKDIEQEDENKEKSQIQTEEMNLSNLE